MGTIFKQGYALIIGVGDCSYSAWSLPTTVKDARAIRSVLTDPQLCGYPNTEEHVRLLCGSEASCTGILSGLEWLQKVTGNDSDSTCFIYYSGHGWLDYTSDKYYLIPSDVNPYEIQSSALSATDFTNNFRKISSKRLIIFFDCCHAEGMTANKSLPSLNLPNQFQPIAPPKSIINELKQGAGRVVFSSSREDQKSWILPDQSMSIYTFHLLEALHGAGNRENDTYVKISNVMNYLGKTVPKSVKNLCNAEQTPYFETASEDFPIALLRSGKGLPIGGWEKIRSACKEKIKLIGNASVGSQNILIDGNFESGNIFNAPVTFNITPNSVPENLSDHNTEPVDKVRGTSTVIDEKTNGMNSAQKNQQDIWRVETPSTAIENITDFFPGTIFPKISRMIYAGGYEVRTEFEKGDDGPKKLTLLKEGKPVDPLVDYDKHILRFPKGTVWITESLVIPFDNNTRPNPESWMLKLPAPPINQKTHMQYGHNEVYIAQEFSFENGYRIITAINPANKDSNKIEVFFFHNDRQIQPIINHDIKTVSFPEV